MNCCPNCFNDPEIKAIISGLATTIGNCDICGNVDEKKIDEDLKCKARTERTLPDNTGRVDIFISGKFGNNNDNTRIIIENKIFASDQHKQIERYFNYLHKNDNNDNNDNPKCKKYLFYLTLEGKDPSQYSLGDLFGTNKISKSKKHQQ